MNNIVPYLCSNLNAWGALGPNTYPRVINTTTQKIPPIVEYIWNFLASIREIPEKYPSICLTPGKKVCYNYYNISKSIKKTQLLSSFYMA